MDDNFSPLLSPTRLWTRSDILQQPCPIPASPGVYAWYFKQIPPLVPTEGCIIWLVHDEPWLVHDELISTVNLPLNLRDNESHPFYPVLSAIRKECSSQ
jgi:hypothetical protein